mmetsp:Transcript_99753/g.310720  ORF Transcript_99753/g.310720 Transcript_99753/m.310720 type:complete len:287 (+) Transcript_99753:51-911(+)
MIPPIMHITKPMILCPSTVSCSVMIPAITIGMWWRLISMPQATAEVSSTTFSSLQLITVMPRAIIGTRSSWSKVTSSSRLNRAPRSKMAASNRLTNPVMGCTRAANCSFDNCPRKDAGGESCVMNWISDHLKEVKSMDITMHTKPQMWALPSLEEALWPLEERPCSVPPAARMAPAQMRRQLRFSRSHIQAVIIMKSTLMFCSMVLSVTDRPSSDLFKKPNSQPCMTPSSTTRPSSSQRGLGIGGELHRCRSDKIQAMVPVVVLTRHVRMNGGSAVWTASLNMSFT